MEVFHLLKSGGVTRRGYFFALLALTALVFTLVGMFLSGGGSGHETAVANEVGSGARVRAAGVTLPITETGESPFVSVVDKSYNSVVNISSNRRFRNRYNDMYDDFLRRFFNLPQRDQVVPSFGSGFIISPDGFVVTNNHVVDGGEDITVTLADKTTHKARIVGTDQATDLAVLKIDADRPLPLVEFGSSEGLKIGDWVVAIGNPFPSLGLDRTVTVGVVSGKGRSKLAFGSETPLYQDYIQTDASINPGNSGGPLLNLNGEVIGVNSAIASPSGGSVGIGFAIPSDLAKEIVSEIVSAGKVTRGYLGVVPRDITADEAEAIGLDKVKGAYLVEVSPNSPAERAGLRADDVVLRFDGDDINGEQDFRMKVASAREGETVKLGLVRKGKSLDVAVTLTDRDAAFAAVNPADQNQGGTDTSPGSENFAKWLGMTVTDCTPELAYRFGVYFHEGAIVVDVETGSAADIKGIVPGFIIAEINYVSISGKSDFEKVAQELTKRDRAIAFHVFDTSGRIGYIAIKPK
jgi:Do/DeqQ family serine protease